MTTPAVQHAVDAAFREERGRVVATLIRRTGDRDLAGECAQEAFTEALAAMAEDRAERLLPAAAGHAEDHARRLHRGAFPVIRGDRRR